MESVFFVLIIAILMLIAVCFIGNLVLAKDTKDFHISFSLKGFDISGSFYEKSNNMNNR